METVVFNEDSPYKKPRPKKRSVSKSKKSKLKISDLNEDQNIICKSKLFRKRRSSREIAIKENQMRKSIALKKKQLEIKNRSIGIKIVKAEMNSVSKRAHYLCKITIGETDKCTKVLL